MQLLPKAKLNRCHNRKSKSIKRSSLKKEKARYEELKEKQKTRKSPRLINEIPDHEHKAPGWNGT